MALTKVTNSMLNLAVAPDATTTALGVDALASNTTGQFHTAVGFEALKQNDVGEQNTAVGYQSLYNAKNYKNPFYPVPDPDPRNEFLETSGNVAVGFKAGYAVQGGNYNIAIGHEAIGIYTAYGAGPFGPAQGSGNIAIGSSAMAKNFTGEQNVAIGGGGVMNYNSSGSNNVAMGWMAMLGDSVNSSVGGENVAIGAMSLYSQQNGDRNTAVGYESMKTLTTGDSNTGVGYRTLSLLTTGADNACLGESSLLSVTSGVGNVAIGTDAGKAITDGVYNTIIGFGAVSNGLPTGASGASNAAVGSAALALMTTGSYNSVLGAEAGASLTTGFGNTILGGYTATGSIAPVFNVTTENNRVVVGTTSTTNAYIQVAWTVVSDQRDKTDIEDIEYGLDFVQKLRPVKFKRDNRSRYEDGVPDGTQKDEKYTLGFLAQNVAEAEAYSGATDLLIVDDEKPDNLKLVETSMIPVLVKALQELKAEFDAYKITHPQGV
jgi:trimeric autotransporter adhesin